MKFPVAIKNIGIISINYRLNNLDHDNKKELFKNVFVSFSTQSSVRYSHSL